MGIEKLEIKQSFGYVTFCNQHSVDPAHLIQLIQSQPKQYQLHTQSGIRFKCSDQDATKRIAAVQQVLNVIEQPVV